MARAKIILEFDGGKRVVVEERSLLPIHGGAQGVVLVQQAFETVVRAFGLQTVTPDEVREEAAAAAAADPGPQTDATPKGDAAPAGPEPAEADPPVGSIKPKEK